MSASPSSHISPESLTRLASKSPNTASNNGDRISIRGSIQKHTKSRSGCKTCKRRKVKCDEKRPSCGNCLKHGSPCDFAALVRRPADIAPVESVAPLNLLDLELLNNFTSSTCNTLSNNSTNRNMWKNSVVRRAINSEFVMRAVLAVSATQMAQHRPNQKHYYLSHAMAYHDIASRKAISMMAEIHSENLEDLWIFSVLTLFFALGSPRDTHASPLQVGENIVPEWIFLFNGVLQIHRALVASSHIGIISPLVNHGKECWIASHQPEHENANILHQLKAHIDATVVDSEQREVYAFAIQELRCQLSYMLSSRSLDIDLADVFVWHAVVADSFMPLLQQGRQEAVAIFAHSLVLLGTVTSSRWMTGWDTFLLARAWDVLDPEHRLWIQWPIEEIGWMPPN